LQTRTGYAATVLQESNWQIREQARRAIFDFVEIWYNRQRRQSSLGYRTPAEFEQLVALPQAA
jgi:transposase InsO family protein